MSSRCPLGPSTFCKCTHVKVGCRSRARVPNRKHHPSCFENRSIRLSIWRLIFEYIDRLLTARGRRCHGNVGRAESLASLASLASVGAPQSAQLGFTCNFRQHNMRAGFPIYASLCWRLANSQWESLLVYNTTLTRCAIKAHLSTPPPTRLSTKHVALGRRSKMGVFFPSTNFVSLLKGRKMQSSWETPNFDERFGTKPCDQ